MQLVLALPADDQHPATHLQEMSQHAGPSEKHKYVESFDGLHPSVPTHSAVRMSRLGRLFSTFSIFRLQSAALARSALRMASRSRSSLRTFLSKFRPKTQYSLKLKSTMRNWMPCDAHSAGRPGDCVSTLMRPAPLRNFVTTPENPVR
jgi:hypothetical protein